jgi:hypothetical protein
MPNDWLLAICLVLIGLLGGLVAVLWFQLWLSRRDANIMRQMSFVTPAGEPLSSGGCLGSLLVSALLVVVGLYFLATTLS